MMVKTILVGQMMMAICASQIANGQTAANLINSTGKASEPTVAVSVGPFNATNNTYWISPAQDPNGLKCELTAEMNKVKSELCLSNQQAINAMREEYDKKYRDSMERVNADMESWFGKMKGVLDEARDTNGKMITSIGIIFAIVIGLLAIVVSVVGIIIPARKEKKREQEFREVKESLKKETESYGTLNRALQQWMNDYDELKMNLTQQKTDYDKLLGELQDQKERHEAKFEDVQKDMACAMNKCMGVTAIVSGIRYFQEYESTRKVDKAYMAINIWRQAVVLLTKGNSGGRLSVVISSLHQIDRMLSSQSRKEEVRKKVQERGWRWDVSLDEVKKVLDATKPDDISQNGDYETFKPIYKDYGLPKE